MLRWTQNLFCYFYLISFFYILVGFEMNYFSLGVVLIGLNACLFFKHVRWENFMILASGTIVCYWTTFCLFFSFKNRNQNTSQNFHRKLFIDGKFVCENNLMHVRKIGYQILNISKICVVYFAKAKKIVWKLNGFPQLLKICSKDENNLCVPLVGKFDNNLLWRLKFFG